MDWGRIPRFCWIVHSDTRVSMYFFAGCAVLPAHFKATVYTVFNKRLTVKASLPSEMINGLPIANNAATAGQRCYYRPTGPHTARDTDNKTSANHIVVFWCSWKIIRQVARCERRKQKQESRGYGSAGFTSSSAMAERPREIGDFKKARVNGGTDVVSVVGRINEVNQHRARLVHDGWPGYG